MKFVLTKINCFDDANINNLCYFAIHSSKKINIFLWF